ncbi:MAG: thiolase family protein [Thermoanaerobaculia bacterium]|nr:thiolase family protein [Thermoanaerobaculia bacterium]
MKPLYVAAYHQSPFGKLGALGVPEILRRAAEETCAAAGAPPSAVDFATVGAACNLTLNRQGLLSGLVAEVPGLAGKPIEAVENACASGGQAVLSVAAKLAAGLGEVGLALGYEKMRGDDGKVDGTRVGEVLGYFSHPDDRPGKVYVFPHLFAEVMAEYMAAWGATEEDLARIAVAEYGNARHNPDAQMRAVELTLEKAVAIEGPNRYIVDGLPLKTYDCSQITDGYAGLLLATREGLARLGVDPADAVRLAGWGQATDPLARAGRDVLRPAGALAAMGRAYEMAGVGPADVEVAEVHDCFSVMGAIGVEVLGLAGAGEGARFWGEGRAAVDGQCGVNLSGGLIAKGHPIGATGVAMIGWCYRQLLGRAPAPLQRRDAKVAATFNIGGPICASVTTVLTRD